MKLLAKDTKTYVHSKNWMTMKTLLSSYDSVVQWNIMQSLKNNLVKEYTAIRGKDGLCHFIAKVS